jgi:hypothetical protein
MDLYFKKHFTTVKSAKDDFANKDLQYTTIMVTVKMAAKSKYFLHLICSLMITSYLSVNYFN